MGKLKPSTAKLLERWRERKRIICAETYNVKESAKSKEARVKKARIDFAYFVRVYFGHLATAPSAPFHIKAANEIKKTTDLRRVYQWARGMAKSSNMGCLIPLWLIIQEKPSFRFMVLVGKSQESATELLQDLQAEIEENALLREDFGDLKATGDWQQGRFTTNHGVTFRALGRGQSPRGLKKKGNRPDYILIDDIDDDEIVHNPSRVDKATEWLMSSLYGTMAVGRGRFIIVGNLISKTGIMARLLSDYATFTVSKVNILDKHGAPSWKENHSIEEIQKIRQDMGERLFNKEYMNDPVIEGSVFKREWIHYGKMLPLKRYSALLAYTDPSWKSSKKNDYKATMLVGKTKEGAYHVLRAYADQTTVSRMVEWHYEINDFINEEKPVRYFMEANLIQDLLKDEFQKVGESIGHQIPLIADPRKKPNKFDRIEALQPLFERGLIILNESEKRTQGMQVLVAQLLGFEKGSTMHDDAPDALEGAISILNTRTRQSGATYRTGGHKNRHY